MRLLTNAGLGDLTDERVVAQLRSKHPARKEAFDEAADAASRAPRLKGSVRGALRGLNEEAATGVSGFRNSY